MCPHTAGTSEHQLATRPNLIKKSVGIKPGLVFRQRGVASARQRPVSGEPTRRRPIKLLPRSWEELRHSLRVRSGLHSKLFVIGEPREDQAQGLTPQFIQIGRIDLLRPKFDSCNRHLAEQATTHARMFLQQAARAKCIRTSSKR